MRALYVALAAVVLCIATPASAGNATLEEVLKQRKEMLEPAVQVRVGLASGSGTVVYSKKTTPQTVCADLKPLDEKDSDAKDAYDECIEGNSNVGIYTYILTNYHVVENAVNPPAKDEDSADFDRKRRSLSGVSSSRVSVTFFNYENNSRSAGRKEYYADVIGYDASLDLAVVRINEYMADPVATAYLNPVGGPLVLSEAVWAVGTGLGAPPFQTTGTLSNLDEYINGERYILASAPIIFGNSGGTLYHFSIERNRYEMIGIPARVSVVFISPVPHMGWSIPMESVRRFLRQQNLSFILKQ